MFAIIKSPEAWVSERATRRYALAVALTAIAFAVRLALAPASAGVQPFAFFYLAVVLTAWWAGTGAAILASALSMATGAYFFWEPQLPLAEKSLGPLGVFTFVSCCLILLTRQARSSQRAALVNAKRIHATEAESAQRGAMLDGLAASLLDGILIVSPAGQIIYANEQFKAMWRLPPEVIATGSDVAALNWAETQVAHPKLFRAGVAEAYRGSRTALRGELEMKDGRVLERYGAPVVNQDAHYGWVWTFRDISDRKRAETQVRQSGNHLRQVLDSLYVFVGMLQADGTLIAVNRASLELAGLTVGDVIGKKFWDAYWWNYSPEVQAQLRSAIEQANMGQPMRYDVEVRMANDTRVWIDFQLAPLRDDRGRITHLIPSAMDVTERRRADAALRQSEGRFRLLLDSTAEGIYGLDAIGNCTFVNRTGLRLLGYETAEELVGTALHARLLQPSHPDAAYSDAGYPADLRLATDDPTPSCEGVFRRRDGSTFPTEYWSHSIVEDGVSVGAVVSFLDITQRKHAEHALRESEQRFHQAFADAPIGMALTDLDGRFQHVNRAYVELTGYSESELRHDLGFAQITHPEDLSVSLDALAQLRGGKTPTFVEEQRFLRQDGTPVWVRVSASLRRDAEGVPFQIIVLAEDISDRKRVQESLQESEQRHRLLSQTLEAERAKLGAIIENLPMGIGVGDVNGTTLSLNKAGLQAHGFTSEQEILSQIGKYVAEFELTYLDGRAMPPENWPAARAIRGDYVKNYELCLRNKSRGFERILSYNVAPVHNRDGAVMTIVYVMQDLTEQRRAQEALRVSEGIMEAFLNASPGILNLFDQELRYLRTDHITPTYFGLDRASIVGKSVDELNPSFAETVLRPMLRRVTESGEPILNIEVPGPAPNQAGALDIWQVSYFPVPLPGGARGLGVMGVDVTQKKRIEDSLREKEELFRAVAENIPQMAWMTGHDGTIHWFNRRWFEYTGTTLAEMQHRGWSIVHDPEHPDRVAAGWIAALRSGEPWEDTFPIRGRDGGYRWFLSRAFPIRDANGKITRWFGTNTDVTEQKRIESALRESEENLRTLLKREADTRQTLVLAMEAGRIGTFSWDVRHDYHVWSKETEQFFGYGPGEFPGTRVAFLDRVHPQDREWLRNVSRRRFDQRQETFSSQYRALRPDNTTAWLSVRGLIEYDDDGQARRMIGVMVDITAMKESEQALADARIQLEHHAARLEQTVAERTARLTETVQELETFSYSLSHDMRAPLRAMKGFSQILETEYAAQLDPHAADYLKKISRAAGRLDQLIQDVLTYSHILRGQISLQPIDIEKLAHQLIDENPALQPPRAEITIRSPLHPVLGHEAYLMQVLSNLVYNAVKFVAVGEQPRVQIWTETTATEIWLFVQDNGIGIPKEAHERMFRMFQRFHGDKFYEGTGIGLTIVRKAVERMGGQISLESEPGKGSTFRVQLRKPQ